MVFKGFCSFKKF
ncbi:hypothetical protein AFULGI_00025190 [Archaeoglobus fulgidus DSM 8774]|uniref:Uncharacterized protein n=1 Tax=Archaeoglobus fulgidus DSM 8774 TaxID=1344584 RepID=A0A075WJ15_ARCFL|nr:hypothetical protein AFULGI_00025190 [Archaeoglobus fulgidus DSM 8774]